jgi:hypothetical protein
MTFPFLRLILERLAYACYLVLLVGSIGFIWVGALIGLETGDYTAMCLPLGGLAFTRWLHLHGHAHWHFDDCREALDRLGAVGAEHSEREEALAAEIAALLARLETEENVWVRGTLRREIAAKLAAAPALREEFAETLASHPGL